jgi:predicted ATPase
VGQTYARARALCEQIGETPQRFSALRGLWQFYHNQGALQSARELGEQLHRLARRQRDSALHLVAHTALGTTLFFLGGFALAHAHLEQGIALDDPAEQRYLAVRYGTAPGIQCRAVAAQALWRLGYPDQALRQSRTACTEAQELAHPPSLAFALYYAIRLHIHRREVQATHAQAERLMALATAQGFAQRAAAARFLRGWALAMQGDGDEALVQMSQGLTAVLTTGQAIIRPIFLTLLAEVYGKVGHVDKALSRLAEAQAAMAESGRSDLQAEIDRLKGEVLLQQAEADMSKVESCFRQALDIACHQGAKSLELRAAMSLSRLWQQQGKRAEAYELLAPIYGWFTEGFDTADLQEAKALLAALGT